jgi:uncharacterized protein
LLLPLLVIGDLIAVWQYRHLFSLKIVRKLLPGTLVGIVLGGLLLLFIHRIGRQHTNLAAALIRMEIGIESILLVSLHWWRQYKGLQQHLMAEPTRSHVSGAFAGTSSTLAHAAGPIVAMYLLPLKMERQLFVGTCAIYFFILNSAKLPVYYFSGQFDYVRLSFTLQFLPLVIVGAIFGYWINKHLNDRLFSRIVYTITFVLGWYILIDGGHTLLHWLKYS